MPFKFGLPPMRAGRRSCASAGCTRRDRARINAATAGILLLIGITLTEVAGTLEYAHQPNRRHTPLVAEHRDRGGCFFYRKRRGAERRGGGSDGPSRANRSLRARP